MSGIYTPGASLSDGAHLDSFGRLRVAEPVQLLDSVMTYSLLPLLWETSLTGSGAITHLPNESSADLDVTTTSGDKVIRQTKSYWRYRAGQSLQIFLTTVFGAAKANVRRRVGYFDADNGIFLEQTSAGMSLVRRTNTSGSAVDSNTAQADWYDPMDGNGPSGITVDWTKTQIILIDLQWLGVGRVRAYLDIDGVPYLIHELKHANSLTVVYMSTARLPVRYEIENTDTAASGSTLKQICSSVVREGATNEPAVATVADTGSASPATSTTLTAMVSVRLKSGYIRSSFDFISWSAINTDTNPARVVVLLNPTIATGSHTWADLDADSPVEVSTAAVTFSAEGHRMDSDSIAGSSGGRGTQGGSVAADNVPAVANIAGTADIITLAAQSSTGTGNLFNPALHINIRE